MIEVPSLIERLHRAERTSEVDSLQLFLEWVDGTGLSLYPAQQEAVLELAAGRHVVLATPTGSGKSLVALACHFFALARSERSFYTSPIKALVSEKFFALCEVLGPQNVGMLTGDASVNRDAPVLCCTAEVLANIALRQGRRADVQHVVMDEFHYFGDRERGMAWQVPLLTLQDARFVLMSATLGDTGQIRKNLQQRTAVTAVEVRSSQRPVPLRFRYSDEPLHSVIEALLRDGQAPIYLVSTTQREAAQQAQNLLSTEIADKLGKRAIAEALGGFRFDSAFGPVLQRAIRHGVGLHHAGLLPKYRLLVERLAQQGLLPVISGTDTLGVGINVPIRTVVLSKLCKFDGEQTRILSAREFHQITGRAGRKGFDDEGFAVVQAPAHVVENRRLAAKAAMAGGKKKFVRRKPPPTGYVPWNEQTFNKLVQARPEPLRSVFKVDHSTLMTMLHHRDGPAAGTRALAQLIGHSHESSAAKRALRAQLATMFRSLRDAGVVVLSPRAARRGSALSLAPGLQRDFSLHHTLSLYLLETVEALPGTGEQRALDIVLLVEAILENPRALLQAQVRREKNRLVAEWKAQGVPYEERTKRLQSVSWPKPKAEWIYTTFNDFAERCPWVGHEHIRPKALAHELLQRFCSFDEFTRELGTQRAEGVLLRYLSQVYKTLTQNIPASAVDESLLDVIATLRAIISRVDSSLVTAWEALMQGTADGTQAHSIADTAHGLDPARDIAALRARIRAEIHALARALAAGDWTEAAACVRRDGEHGYAAHRFQSAITAFHDAFGPVVFDHRARLADKLHLSNDGPRRWRVTLTLMTERGESDHAIHALVDLGADAADPAAPLLTVLRIGP